MVSDKLPTATDLASGASYYVTARSTDDACGAAGVRLAYTRGGKLMRAVHAASKPNEEQEGMFENGETA